MTKILHIETATQVCSVALSIEDQIVGYRESHEPNAHARILTLLIDELIKETGLYYQDLDAIAVSMGPGSYTGLRIGISSAKGLCFALDKPLLAIGTLQVMATGMIREYPRTDSDEKILFCPMIDARRMEVYSALFDIHANMTREVKAEIISKNSFAEILTHQKIVFAGDGSVKCQHIMSHNQNACFLENFYPSARYMTGLAYEKYQKKCFENVAYFEPFYLKDFIAAMPNVKGLI